MIETRPVRSFRIAQAQDEKFVTERAYEKPGVCEDLVRNVALKLNAHRA